jgi:hypothetical protein
MNHQSFNICYWSMDIDFVRISSIGILPPCYSALLWPHWLIFRMMMRHCHRLETLAFERSLIRTDSFLFLVFPFLSTSTLSAWLSAYLTNYSTCDCCTWSIHQWFLSWRDWERSRRCQGSVRSSCYLLVFSLSLSMGLRVATASSLGGFDGGWSLSLH